MRRSSGRSRAAVAVACLALVAVAGASARPEAVAFTVQGRTSGPITVAAGASIAFAARAPLKAGDSLGIVATRAGESDARVVAACRKTSCAGKWRETAPITVKFVAAVIRGTGKSARVVDKSKVIAVEWKAAGPYATPGHYEGRSSQNELFAFDVTADGRQVANLRTGQINGSCPDGANTWGGNLSVPGPWPITAGRTFSISIPNEKHTVNGEPATRSITINGTFSGTTATGTLLVDIDWPPHGRCTSGNQTWTVPRVS